MTNSAGSVPAQARDLLRRFEQEGDRQSCSDDLLLFLYRLRDRGTIIESHSALIRGRSFHPLHALIYDLESRPDEAVRDEHQSGIIRTLLGDLASGKIIVSFQTD